jgi:outer membrane lipoprotein carrier protein
MLPAAGWAGKRNFPRPNGLRYDHERDTMRAALPLTVLALLAPAPPAHPAAGPEKDLARSLVRRVEERHARAADLVARFTQSYRSGMLGREVVERGVVSIKRPGRMRWEYKDPEAKLFVSDGRTFYFYVPADRQVVVSAQDAERSLAGRLLSGRGGILEEFDASLEEPLEEGVLRVKLVPRREQPDVERAFLDVEPSGRIRSILLEDVQGNRTRFRFENVRENTGVPDKLFRFDIPAGVEVIRG